MALRQVAHSTNCPPAQVNHASPIYLCMPMEKLNGLFANMERYVTLSPTIREELGNLAVVRPVKKRQFICQPGFICRHRNYVNRGAFRSYYIDKTGKEHTVQLSVEDWFISDFYSYITETPGTLFVEALEDGELVSLPHDAIEALSARSLPISEYFRRTTERAFAFSRIRVQSNIGKDAEQRYVEFRDRYPSIVNRMPQYAVASYLGMSPEFLSKIRARLAAG